VHAELEETPARFQGQKLSVVRDELGKSEQLVREMMRKASEIEAMSGDAMVEWIKAGSRKWEDGYVFLLEVRIGPPEGTSTSWVGYATLGPETPLVVQHLYGPLIRGR
jgi:hypothetical protein